MGCCSPSLMRASRCLMLKKLTRLLSVNVSILWALDKYYPYLYGKHVFTIQTDHKPLAYLQSAKLTNTRLMRWSLRIQPFYVTVEAITGGNNIGADYLSRC